MPSVPRQELEAILSKIGWARVLAETSDESIEQQVRERILPLNITTLAEAKSKFAEVTGWSIYMLLPDPEDHQQLWSILQTYLNQLQ